MCSVGLSALCHVGVWVRATLARTYSFRCSIPEPDHVVLLGADKDTWIIISSDGLYANTERGGGGGFENEGVGAVLAKEGGKAPDEVAKLLALQAQKMGSTDDVTVIALKLGS